MSCDYSPEFFPEPRWQKYAASPCSVVTRCPSSPASAATRCPSWQSTPIGTPRAAPLDVAGVCARFEHWQQVEHCPGDLERCVKVCACWGLDLRSLDLPVAEALLQALLGTLRLFHCIDLPEGDLEHILAAGAEYGARLDFGARLGAVDPRQACLDAIMIFFLAQTYLCDEPCFVPTWLSFVAQPMDCTFKGMGMPGADLASLDYTVLGLFEGLAYLLAPGPRCAPMRAFLAGRAELVTPEAPKLSLRPLFDGDESPLDSCQSWGIRIARRTLDSAEPVAEGPPTETEAEEEPTPEEDPEDPEDPLEPEEEPCSGAKDKVVWQSPASWESERPWHSPSCWTEEPGSWEFAFLLLANDPHAA